MTKRFFWRIQNSFKASYGGRYVAVILAELLRAEPGIADFVFGTKGLASCLRKGDCIIDLEYSFLGKYRKRRADLAIVERDDPLKALALLEIKYDDHRNQKNEDQFKDYLEVSSARGCKFAILSKYVLPKPPEGVAENQVHLHLFSDVAQFICSNKKRCEKPALRMYVDFVEDLNLMFTPVKKVYLKMMLEEFFPDSGKSTGIKTSKKKRSASNVLADIPDTFKAVINNVSVVLRHISPHIRGDGRQPTINFSLDPWVKMAKVSANAVSPNYKERKGGILWTWGKYHLTGPETAGDSRLELQTGIGYQTNEVGSFRIFVYAEFQGTAMKKPKKKPKEQEEENYTWADCSVRYNNYKEEHLVKTINGAILESIGKALSHGKLIAKDGILAIEQLRKRLAGSRL